MGILKFNPSLGNLMFSIPKFNNMLSNLVDNIAVNVGEKRANILSNLKLDDLAEEVKTDLNLKREIKDLNSANSELMAEYKKSLANLDFKRLEDIQREILILTKRRLEVESKRQNQNFTPSIEKLTSIINSNQEKSAKLEVNNTESTAVKLNEITKSNSNVSSILETESKERENTNSKITEFNKESVDYYDEDREASEKTNKYLKAMVLSLSNIHKELLASTGMGVSDLLEDGLDLPSRGKKPTVPRKKPKGKLGKLRTAAGKLGTKVKGLAKAPLSKVGTVAKTVGAKLAPLIGISGLGAGGTGATVAGASLGTAAAGVGAAAVGGAAVGTLINKGISLAIDKFTGGESKDLGQYIENVVSREKGAEAKNKEIVKWKPRFSPQAFILAGGEKNFSSLNFFKLKQEGLIVPYGDKWVLKSEVIEKVKPEVITKPIESKVESIKTDKLEKVMLKETPYKMSETIKKEIKETKSLDKVVKETSSKPVKISQQPVVIPVPKSGSNVKTFRPNTDSITDSGVDAIRTFLS